MLASKVEKITRFNEDSQITEVAVLVSPGFGAGWSSWNREHSNALLFSSNLIEYVLACEEGRPANMENTLEAMTFALIGEEIYCGAAESLIVIWVPEGEKFVINEYDGSESLRLEKNFEWMEA
jgi:hypothetical protein